MRIKLALHWQILIAIAVGIVFGVISNKYFAWDVGLTTVSFVETYDLIGKLFLNALKMIVVPLIVASIITSIANLGGTKGLGRLSVKTILFYLFTSLIAILIALALSNMVKPGYIDGKPAIETVKLPKELDEERKKIAEKKGMGTIKDVILSMIPTNVINTASDNRKILGLIVFSILFAIFLGRLSESLRGTQMSFWEGLFEIMMRLTMLIMKFAPIGVFGLVAASFAEIDLNRFWDIIGMLAVFSVTVVAALLIHAFIVVPIIIMVMARANPIKHYKAMAPALLTAFSTASSSATLPLTLECVEEKAGVSKRTSSFVLPLGATVNMDGTALYECAAALFIAQAYGVDLPIAMQMGLVVVALLTSVGVAGVPSASLVAIVIILGVFKVPGEGIMLLIVFDRILDMMRTSVNVLSDSVAAVVIATLEGEKNLYPDHPKPVVSDQN
jgi:Na+/H+-dicarboxylate symporter